VCRSDAEGNGNPDLTDNGVAGTYGPDLDRPILSQGETFAMAIDFNLDVAQYLPLDVSDVGAPFIPVDIVIGVPGGQPTGGRPPLPCTSTSLPGEREYLSAPACGGVYTYHQDAPAGTPLSQRFLSPKRTAMNAPWPWEMITPNTTWHHLEIKIFEVSKLRADFDPNSTLFDRRAPWELLMQAYAVGAAEDALSGDDAMPNNKNDYQRVLFPCLFYDVCGFCLGDGQGCRDCAGTVNGTAVYDVCGVCAGTRGERRFHACCSRRLLRDSGFNNTCNDCLGVPNGNATIDVCGLCGGNNSSCVDCTGTRETLVED